MSQIRTKSIRYDYEHCHITKPLRQLMQTSMAKESTRYAINGIYAKNNSLIVTDGRRLLMVHIQQEVPSMIYRCVDGWLLGPMAGNFPKYKDIIPQIKKSKLVFELDSLEYRKTGEQEIFAALATAEYFCDAGMLLEVLAHIDNCGGTDYKFYVDEKSPDDMAMLMTCNCRFGEITYVQMPVKHK